MEFVIEKYFGNVQKFWAEDGAWTRQQNKARVYTERTLEAAEELADELHADVVEIEQ
jgi:hypothetical protein